jgi:hypothetical protein
MALWDHRSGGLRPVGTVRAHPAGGRPGGIPLSTLPTAHLPPSTSTLTMVP